MKRRIILLTHALAFSLLTAQNAAAQSQDLDLLKDIEGPFNTTKNIPLRNEFEFNYGINPGTLYTLNIEPVFPMNMGGLNSMHQLSLPVISQPEPSPGAGGTFGLGDLEYRYLLFAGSPSNGQLGGGAVLSIPSSTDTSLGSGKWSFGPALGGTINPEPWFLGALLRQIWSFAGDSGRPYVSQGEARIYAYYNYAGGFYFVINPYFTVDWTEEGDKFRIPLGGGVGKLFEIDGMPTNVSVQGYYHAERPQNDANWSLRFLIQLVFP